MGIGLGVILLVLGLILVLGAVEMPAGVEDVVATDMLGWILVGGGVLALVMSLVITQQRSRTTHVEERRTDRM